MVLIAAFLKGHLCTNDAETPDCWTIEFQLDSIFFIYFLIIWLIICIYVCNICLQIWPELSANVESSCDSSISGFWKPFVHCVHVCVHNVVSFKYHDLCADWGVSPFTSSNLTKGYSLLCQLNSLNFIYLINDWFYYGIIYFFTIWLFDWLIRSLMETGPHLDTVILWKTLLSSCMVRCNTYH